MVPDLQPREETGPQRPLPLWKWEEVQELPRRGVTGEVMLRPPLIRDAKSSKRNAPLDSERRT